MILALNTSTPTCEILLFDASGNEVSRDTWEAGRQLSEGLLAYIAEMLSREQLGWKDLTGLVVFKGPGSFTGLRIGITVFNTVAASEKIPIIGAEGDDWLARGVGRILAGENDELVLPEYGAGAHITQPRK